MPFECYFQSRETDLIYSMEPFGAGEFTAVIDYAGRVILAYCYKHDLGGEVYILDREDVELKEDGIRISADLITEENTTLVPANSVFHEFVTDKDGEEGIYFARHRLPHTTSMN